MSDPAPTQKPIIAFLLEYPLAYGGGVSVLVRHLVESLADRYALVLVSPDTAADLERSGAATFLHAHVPWANERMTAERARELAELLIAQRVELAHFHQGGHVAWGSRTPWTSPLPRLRKAGVRCLATTHSVVSPARTLLAPGTAWWFAALKLTLGWLGKMRAIAALELEITVSQHDLQRLRRWYFPFRRFTCIYHSRLRDQPAPTGPRQPMILHVGHRAWRKGQQDLVLAFIKIAPRHPTWELTLVGPVLEPAYEEKLVAAVHAARLEGRIHLLGQRDDAVELMRTAAIYVQPSLEEALGLALQEALFEGCACLGTRVGGIPELIEHGRTGLLTRPTEVGEMAEALDELMSDAALRERLGTAGAASIRARGMTAESMVAQYAALYEKLLPPRP